MGEGLTAQSQVAEADEWSGKSSGKEQDLREKGAGRKELGPITVVSEMKS